MAPSLRQTTFAFLDTETTGLSSRMGDRVCEVAILTVRGRRRLSMYRQLINPQRRIPEGARAIHGIGDDMVADSPTFSQLAKKIGGRLEGKAVVCHNAPFDMGFMEAEFARAGVPMPEMTVVDTLALARRHFNFSSNRLGAIAVALGIETEGLHRAAADVEVLHKIFERFLEDFERRGVTTLDGLRELCPARKKRY